VQECINYIVALPGGTRTLIFHTDENQALIATDTLAVHPDGRPHHTMRVLIVVNKWWEVIRCLLH
jgi:hypothetical protein